MKIVLNATPGNKFWSLGKIPLILFVLLDSINALKEHSDVRPILKEAVPRESGIFYSQSKLVQNEKILLLLHCQS